MISASHNPEPWNAFKLYHSRGGFLNSQQNKQLTQLWKGKNWIPAHASQLGMLKPFLDCANAYVQALLKHIRVDLIRKAQFRVYLDSCNGAGSEITPRLLQALGCEVQLRHCEPNQGFPRNPEPVESHLHTVMQDVAAHGCDIAFVQDPDADRLVLLTGEGEFLGEEATLVLASQAVLKHCRGPLVTNLSSTSQLDEVAAFYQVPLERTAVGEAHVVHGIGQTQAVIGGEGNGGVIWPQFNSARDSLVGIALILQLLAEEQVSVKDLVQRWKARVMLKSKLSFIPETWPVLQEKLSQTFQKMDLDCRDGLKWSNAQQWLHVRPSNTEPVLRVIVEALNKQSAHKLLTDVQEALSQVSNPHPSLTQSCNTQRNG